jgi:TctA family transporter
MPIILMSGVVVMLLFGIVGFFLDETGFPAVPVILGMIAGPMLERSRVAGAAPAGSATA